MHRILLLVVLAFALVIPAAAPAFAQVLPAPTVQGVGPVAMGEDYASSAFGDPWDYSNPEDVNLDAGPAQGIDASSLGNGALSIQADSTAFVPLVFPGYDGALGAGREGLAAPIDADRFTHLAVRLWSPGDVTVGAFYGSCLTGCEGHVSFFAHAGWNTYDINLAAPPAGFAQGEPWRGAMRGLRLAFGITDGVQRTFVLDDVRLYAPVGPDWAVSYVNPTPNIPGNPARLLWDRDADPANNTPDRSDWGVLATTYDAFGSATFTPGMLGAGLVWFHVASGALRGAVAGPFTVDPVPMPRVLDPDAAGGEDFVTATTGDPWDFEQPTDGAVGGAADVAWSGGALHGTNAGNDPFVELRLPHPVDTTRYHRLTVVADYDGPFGLEDASGGGAHGRLLWRVDGLDRWIDGRELVTYTGTDTYTVELLGNPGGPAYDDETPAIDWAAAPAIRLRYDPNEDRGARRWRLHELRLAADDETTAGAFTVRWDDPAALAGTTVEWFADTDRSGFDGVPISAPLAQQPGENRFEWHNTQLPAGRYWLYAVSRAGLGVARAYAGGPVVATPFTGEPAAAPVPDVPSLPDVPEVAVDDGMRMAGATRVATAVAVAQAAFPDGAPVVVLARDDAYPDALAAAPLAAAYGGPLLLNPRDALHETVAEELVRLGAGTVLLMGGPAAQSEGVEAALRQRGLLVTRVAGPDRFATAALAGRQAVERWRGAGVEDAGSTAVIATANSFADALAAGPLAVARHAPLLLVAGDVLPQPTSDALADLDVDEVVIAGGPAAVATSLETTVADAGRPVTRLAGPDRFATGVALAEAAIAAGATPAGSETGGRPASDAAWNWSGQVLVASGVSFPDALAAGPAAAALGGVLLLTDPQGLPIPVAEWLAHQGTAVHRVRVVGGAGAITDQVLTGLMGILAAAAAAA